MTASWLSSPLQRSFNFRWFHENIAFLFKYLVFYLGNLTNNYNKHWQLGKWLMGTIPAIRCRILWKIKPYLSFSLTVHKRAQTSFIDKNYEEITAILFNNTYLRAFNDRYNESCQRKTIFMDFKYNHTGVVTSIIWSTLRYISVH